MRQDVASRWLAGRSRKSSMTKLPRACAHADADHAHSIRPFGACVLIGIFVTLFGARDRIDSETESGGNLGSFLIEYALDDVNVSPQPEEALKRLQAGLSQVRPISVRYLANSE